MPGDLIDFAPGEFEARIDTLMHIEMVKRLEKQIDMIQQTILTWGDAKGEFQNLKKRTIMEMKELQRKHHLLEY